MDLELESLCHGMHVKVVAGSLQIDERRRRDAHLAVEEVRLRGFDRQPSLGEFETRGQRFRFVSFDAQTLEADVTRVGEVTRLDLTRDWNAEPRSPLQVYRIFHLEGRRQEPHGDTITHRTGEVRLQYTAYVDV